MSTTQARSRHRRMAGVALAALCAVGLGTGSATQLNLGQGAVGSGAAVVGDCQGATPVRVQLSSAWVTNQFRTTGMRLIGVAAACGTQQYRVTLVNAAGASLAEVTGAVPAGGGDFNTSTFAAVTTAQVDHAEIVIFT
jgi:hypothetical protein